MAKPTKEIEVISPEVMAELQSIHEQIRAYKSKINELTERADELVPKHDLEDCREFGCIHTCHKQAFCDCYTFCIRSKWAHGAYRDCFVKKQPVFKPRVDYPTLGWKVAVCSGSKWQGVWHTKKVIKETDKTLILEDKTQLLKSTMFTLEDCVFLKDRSENTWMCADNPETLDIQRTLLDVAHREWLERNSCSIAKIKLD